MDLTNSTIEKLTFEAVKAARFQCTPVSYNRLLAEHNIERAM